MNSSLLTGYVFIASSPGHDPVVKCDLRFASAEFTHFKASSRLLCYIESATVSIRSQKNVVGVFGIHRLSKQGIKRNAGDPIVELGAAEIFKPIPGTFYSIKRHLALVGQRDHCRLCPGSHEIAVDFQITDNLQLLARRYRADPDIAV